MLLPWPERAGRIRLRFVQHLGNVGIDTALALVMLVIAIIGIKITAQTQIGMAVIEYGILVGSGSPGWSSCSATATAPIARPSDLVSLGVLPLGAAGFLGWIIVKSMLRAPRTRTGPLWASSSWVWS